MFEPLINSSMQSFWLPDHSQDHRLGIVSVVPYDYI